MDVKSQLQYQRNVFRAKYIHNSVFHLILACTVAFVFMQAINLILVVMASEPKTVFDSMILPNLGLQPFHSFIYRPWVLFSYFWFHVSFLNMLSNMLWLYLFGSVILSFVGYREVIPMFIVTSVAAGAGYLLVTVFWKDMPMNYQLNSLPGLMAIAFGAFTLVPSHKFYITDHFGVPIWLALLVFLVLHVLTMNYSNPMLILVGFAALFGFGYIKLLQNGYRPGRFVYGIGNKIQSFFTPADVFSGQHNIKRKQTLKMSKHQVVENPTEEYIDALLDKISNKGYNSLTDSEKETLKNAGRS